MDRSISKRALFPFAALVLGFSFVVACGNDDDAPFSSTPDSGVRPHDDAGETADTSPPDASDGSTGDGGPDGAITPTCDSPVHITADATAKSRAVTALGTLSPEATLEWSDVRGTLTSIGGLTVTPDCSDPNTNVYDKLFDYLEASPELFQIDRTEWKPDGANTCSDIGGFQLLAIRRQKLGPYELHNDVFSVVADVADGHVIFRNFSGTYVPKPSTELLAKLGECTDLPDETLLAAVRKEPFTYQVYAEAPAPMCTIETSAKYTALANDDVRFDTPSELLWEENTDVSYHRQRAAVVLLPAANQTPDLVRSSANCTDLDGNPRIGWIRTVDVANGNILADHDTPDPYCSVCFAPQATDPITH